ncbi:MAG: hypothetical protein MI807_09795 [Verrucomicrobiales bacterium]|nr:hypothetical protein [Verrucomicrobiales bacterium]
MKGLKVKFEPTDAAIEGLNKHIRETLRAFPVADLAKMILKERERYQVRFETDEGGAILYRCKADHSLWLSREEAISHLLSGNTLDKYYDVEEVDIGAPSGNFAQIAVCGMSGTLLGPPNHHEYQRNVMRLHAEKFSNMSLERFKSRIEMQSDEEVIEKWKESVSKQRQYRLKSDKPEEGGSDESVDEESSTDAEVSGDTEPQEMAGGTSEVDGAEQEDKTVDGENALGVEVQSTGEAEPENSEGEGGNDADKVEQTDQDISEPAADELVSTIPEKDVLVLKSPEELARHFKKHFAEEAIEATREAVVPGDIPGRFLSHALLNQLKRESESLRRGFPLAMVQAVCSALEKQGLRFFKRGKKALHVSAIRPRPINDSVSFSSEVQAIVDYVLKHSGARVMDLLNELADDFVSPEKNAPTESLELTDGARKVLKDLRWLTSEGYLIELPDTRVVMGKAPRDENGGQNPAKKVSKKKAVKKKAVVTDKLEKETEAETGEAAVSPEKAKVVEPEKTKEPAVEQEQLKSDTTGSD